jgi:hypothetical protein
MAAPHGAGDVCLFDALPVAVLRRILGALPIDSRGRACAVCRAWRDVLADASLWQVLDLTPAGGVPEERVTANLALASAARAAGQLRFMNLGRFDLANFEYQLVEAHGGSLRELHCHGFPLATIVVRLLLDHSPHLEQLHAAVELDASDAGSLLRKEPPFGPVRAHQVDIICSDGDTTGVLLEVARAVVAHSHIRVFSVDFRDLDDDPAVLDAFLDAVRVARIPFLYLESSRFRPGNDRALARLLRCDTLTSLHVGLNWGGVASEEGIELLAAALQDAVHLKKISLRADLWDCANYGVMMAALRALPALQELNLLFNSAAEADKGAVGRVLGALLAANRPCLHTLKVEHCDLNDEGIGPLLAGLSANTHLRTLACRFNGVSDDFERDIQDPVLAALAARSAAPQ